MAQPTIEKNVSKAKSTAKKEIDKVPNDLGAEKASETIKETALAGLGVVGKLIDGVQNSAGDVRSEASEKWNQFIARGEQLKDTATDKVGNYGFSFKYDMKEQRAQFRDLVSAVFTFAKPGKAELKTSES